MKKIFIILPQSVKKICLDPVFLLPQSEKNLLCSTAQVFSVFHVNSIVRSSRFLIIEICQTDTYSAEPLTQLSQLFAGF